MADDSPTMDKIKMDKIKPTLRKWLLERDSDDPPGRTGVLPLGKVGMLAAAGGVGKTMALCQLAVSVATGEKWLGTYHTPNPGRVALLLGEEDEEEVRRRIYNASRVMKLGDEARKLVLQNVTAVPLSGTPVALTENDAAGNVQRSAMLEHLHTKLGSVKDWRLIVLDPLARWSGSDAEKDNAAATRFLEAVETLTTVDGRPTVLVAHHTNKDQSDAMAARGVTGIHDAMRWAAGMLDVKPIEGLPDRVQFTYAKSNYGPKWPAVVLVRDRELGGALRLPSEEEREDFFEAAGVLD